MPADVQEQVPKSKFDALQRANAALLEALQRAAIAPSVALAVSIDDQLTLVFTNGVIQQRASVKGVDQWVELDPVPLSRAAIIREAIAANREMAVVA